jgi:hypothetical protein
VREREREKMHQNLKSLAISIPKQKAYSFHSENLVCPRVSELYGPQMEKFPLQVMDS